MAGAPGSQVPQPETIAVDAIVSADVVIAALRTAGATVRWMGELPSAQRLIQIKVTVDAEDAYDALPAWMMPDHEPDWSEPDPADLGDFIGACMAGDRRVATALLPRLNLSAACSYAGERLLLGSGS